jgi:hypothetical protein
MGRVVVVVDASEDVWADDERDHDFSNVVVVAALLSTGLFVAVMLAMKRAGYIVGCEVVAMEVA